METKIILFVFYFSISTIQSSQNVEKLPNTSSTIYHSPANEVSSSFYFTQNLQSYKTAHDDNNHPHNGPQHLSPFTQTHYSPSPVRVHPPQTSLNSLSNYYSPPLKLKSQPPQVQYNPSYFETSTTAPKSSLNYLQYNQYIPPPTHYSPPSIAYQQKVTPSNQIDPARHQYPFPVSTPFVQQNIKGYSGSNEGGFPNDFSKNRFVLLPFESQNKVHATPKMTNPIRSDLGTVSTTKPLHFSQAGGAVSHVEFSSADVNYKW